MSLRARLMALILLATLVPALLLGLRFFQDSRSQIVNALRLLEQSAGNIVEALNDRVQGTAQLHYGLAHSRVLDDDERQACSEYLSQVREYYPQYTGIITVRPDGQLHCDSLRSGRKLDLTDRGYFKRVMTGARGLTLEPVFGRLTGTAVLQVVYPARRDDGVLRFMLVASLNLKSFTEDSRRQVLRQDSQLMLLDPRGMLLTWAGAGAPPVTVGSALGSNPLAVLARAHPRGGTGEIVGDDGVTRVWAVAAAPDAGLQVLLGVPRHALVADAEERLAEDLAVLAVSALLLFIGVWVLAEWGVRRQVSRITTMVRTLGQGDLAVRIAAPHPRGELGDLMEQLNGTAAALQQQRAAIEELGLRLRQAQKLEAIGTLAGGIAHDFNNIVGAILGNLALAQQDLAAGRPAEESLQQIQRAALRARELVQRIQTFSRADAPSLGRQSMRRIVEEVLPLVQVTMPAGATLRSELQSGECPVWADATQMHQVLLNLCTNAWQALQGQAGLVTVSLDSLAADAPDRPSDVPHLPAGPLVRLGVSDTGSGIRTEHRERIFEPYFSTKGGSGGTGLGLSVVHGIVQAHRGAIRVDSRPGAGSRFTVYLPLLTGAEEVAAPTIPATSIASEPAGQGQRVVYVDDDEVIALLVERLLVRAGYRVRCHPSARAALAELNADPSACELVVTDFNMPDMSGLDLSHAVAALRGDLPVILTTGHIAEDLPEQARGAGVCEVIGKQNLLEELVPAVRRALAQTA